MCQCRLESAVNTPPASAAAANSAGKEKNSVDNSVDASVDEALASLLKNTQNLVRVKYYVLWLVGL